MAQDEEVAAERALVLDANILAGELRRDFRQMHGTAIPPLEPVKTVSAA